MIKTTAHLLIEYLVCISYTEELQWMIFTDAILRILNFDNASKSIRCGWMHHKLYTGLNTFVSASYGLDILINVMQKSSLSCRRGWWSNFLLAYSINAITFPVEKLLCVSLSWSELSPIRFLGFRTKSYLHRCFIWSGTWPCSGGAWENCSRGSPAA